MLRERWVEFGFILCGALGALLAICAEVPLSADVEYQYSKCVTAGTATCKDCLEGFTDDPACTSTGKRCRVYSDPQSTQNFQFKTCIWADSARYNCVASGQAANTCSQLPYWNCQCAIIFNGQTICTDAACFCNGPSPGKVNLTPANTCTDGPPPPIG